MLGEAASYLNDKKIFFDSTTLEGLTDLKRGIDHWENLNDESLRVVFIDATIGDLSLSFGKSARKVCEMLLNLSLESSICFILLANIRPHPEKPVSHAPTDLDVEDIHVLKEYAEQVLILSPKIAPFLK